MSRQDLPPIKDSGERRVFPTGAQRDVSAGKGRFDLICGWFEAALARQLQKGAEKYGENNWRKGMPQSVFLDSAKRHLNAVERGQVDEDHMAAAAFNIMCLLSQRERMRAGILPRRVRVPIWPGALEPRWTMHATNPTANPPMARELILDDLPVKS